MKQMNEYINELERSCRENDFIDRRLYDEYDINQGLRDEKGNGVLTGLTNISLIKSFDRKNGVKEPCDGELWYRGYRVEDLISRLGEEEMGYEKIAYLLLVGELPDEKQFAEFRSVIGTLMALPTNFTRDVIMKAPTDDIMNTMTRSILTLASYDWDLKNTSLENNIRQCLQLISQFPTLAVYAYNAYNHYQNLESMYIHYPDPDLSPAENILTMLRPDKKYTKTEAKVLDTALILHMEHGGGNNSTFTTHVVSSSGTDTYSAVAAALGSLKGPRHGGANIKVCEMMADMKEKVADWSDDGQIEDYLKKLLHKDAFDRAGLIYGIGHAVYSVSDPRAEIFRGFVEKLAEEKHLEKEFALYSAVERLAPGVIASERKIYKGVSANVDFYSGFVYNMLGLPVELFTPIFAVARIAGWSAHRLEELVGRGKIIRPAYMAVHPRRGYKEIGER